MPDHHDLIVGLEAEIHELHEAVERCRKIELAAKAALVGGCLIVGIGFIWHSPLALVIAIGALLGSLALLGSNQRTLDDNVAALRVQQAKRSKLIESMELRAVNVELSMPERG
jgi:hypothetical protein